MKAFDILLHSAMTANSKAFHKRTLIDSISGMKETSDSLYRCISWLYYMDLYPDNSFEWPAKLEEYKQCYSSNIEEFKLSEWTSVHINSTAHNQSLPKTGFDEGTMNAIHQDLLRTQDQMIFLKVIDVKDANRKDDSMIGLYEQHMRRMERIIYIFCALNPWIGYMQGFNELLQPLYFVITSASSLFNEDFSAMEAIIFQMFYNLLTRTRLPQFFSAQCASKSAIAQIKRMDEQIAILLPELSAFLSGLDIGSACYSFRWYGLLFSQDFDFPNLLLIWDKFMPHFKQIIDYAFFFGVGLLKQMQPQIMKSDYSSILKGIQNLSSGVIIPALTYADSMWKEADSNFSIAIDFQDD